MISGLAGSVVPRPKFIVSLLAVLVIATTALAANTNKVLTVNSVDVVKLGIKLNRKPLYCLNTVGSSRQVGSVKPKGKKRRFSRILLKNLRTRSERKIYTKALKKCRRLASPPLPPPRNSNQGTPVPCTPSLSGASATIIENSDLAFELQPVFGCGSIAHTFELVGSPSNGTVVIEENVATYTGTFFDGIDRFSIRVCVRDGSECSQPAQFNVTSVAGELTGRQFSLRPYKDHLTEHEVRYLLNKVAFGGCPNLVTYGVEHGLTQLIEHMLDENNGGCEYSLPILPGGYVGQHSAPENTSADAYAYWMAHPRHWNLPIQYWNSDLLYRGIVVNLRYGNPLREFMWSMVWDPHFATNVLDSQHGSLHDAKLHYNALSNNALGNFEDFFREFYGPLNLPASPAVRRVPGVDPALLYNPDRSSPSGTEIYPTSGTYRAYGLNHFQRYLNNETNAEPSANYPLQHLNENLGRESLELHTLGAFDIISGQSNYTEDDVFTSTRALTGFALDFDGNFDADNNPSTHLTSRDIDDAGPWRVWTSFFDNRSSAARGIIGSLFAGSNFTRLAAWQAQDWNSSGQSSNIFVHMLRNHPAAARRLAARLFATLVGPDLLDDRVAAEAIVQRIASELQRVEEVDDPVRGVRRSTSFNIPRAIRLILGSEAMFARRAGGFTSPLEHVISTFRIANVALTNQYVPDMMVAELSSAGQVPLSPPSVFAWPSSGTPSTGFFHTGSAWLDTSPLLAIHRAILRALNQTFVPAAGPPRMGDIIFPNGTTTCTYFPQVRTDCPSAREVVEHVLRLFNLDGNDEQGQALLGVAERQVLIDFLDRPSSPWPQADLWRASIQDAPGLVVQRGVGLLQLVATHPLRFRK